MQMHKLMLLLSLSIFVFAGAARAQAGNAAKQQSIQDGHQVFIQRCMQCHSVNKDQVLLGPSLWSEMSRSPHKKTAAQIRVILRDGKGKMPPWKDILAPDDVDDVLVYLRSL
jgi:mono/diheme cytochrome c family protein